MISCCRCSAKFGFQGSKVLVTKQLCNLCGLQSNSLGENCRVISCLGPVRLNCVFELSVRILGLFLYTAFSFRRTEVVLNEDSN